MHVLIVEDDTETAEFLMRSLQEAGESGEFCESVENALTLLQSTHFDVIIFDRLLPGIDGKDAVRQLRTEQVTTPILMLTALSGIDDRVDGLNAGADDYMVKPFAFSELYARLQALLRRQQVHADASQLQVGDLTLDRTTQKVTRNSEDIALPRREYKILELLMQNAGQVVTRTMLLEKVWGYSFDPYTSIVQTHVSRLRAKVDKPFDQELIQRYEASDMSSAISAKEIIRSSTFRHASAVALVCITIIGIVGAGYDGYRLQQADRAEIDLIHNHLDDLAIFIKHDGMAKVIAEYSQVYGPIWPSSEAHYLLADDEILLLIEQNDTAVIGFVELKSAADQRWLEFPIAKLNSKGEPPELLPVRVVRRDLANGVTVFGAYPRSEAYFLAKESLWHGVIFLMVVITPMVFLGSAMISAYILRRLHNHSDAVQQMELGNFDAAAPISPAHDEFDQIAVDINSMLAQIKLLLQNLENVSVGVAHDLRTPLTHLDQRLQRIAHDIHSPKDIQQHLDAAHEQLHALLGTFNALLRLGEIESGKRREHFKPTELSELVQDLAETYQAVFEEQGRKLDISVIPGQIVSGDAQLLEQLISNLLENILTHAHPNGHAWIRLQPHSRGAALQVGDDGPGIPAADQAKVFDRFYQVDRSRKSEGNGLGLSLVASIAKLHGATVDLHKNQPGTVLDFVFLR